MTDIQINRSPQMSTDRVMRIKSKCVSYSYSDISTGVDRNDLDINSYVHNELVCMLIA